MPEESLLQDMKGEVIHVYAIKSIFNKIKNTYMIES
jgi:hypothetical protein